MAATSGRCTGHPTADDIRKWREQTEELRETICQALANYSEPGEGRKTNGCGWWSPLWQVVREAKAHPLLRDRDGYSAWLLVKSIVSLDELVAADSRLEGEQDVATTWADTHDRVRYLPGQGLLGAALRESLARPVAPPRDRGSGYARFLALLAAYARLRQQYDSVNKQTGGLVAIPLERWAELLEVRPMTFSAWRRWAVEDGILTLHRQYSNERRRANEYHVNMALLRLARGTP